MSDGPPHGVRVVELDALGPVPFARAGHDIDYVSLTGAPHAMGPSDAPPTGAAPRFSRTPGAGPRPPVARRADTDAVLADLGATPDEIEGWRRDGIVD